MWSRPNFKKQQLLYLYVLLFQFVLRSQAGDYKCTLGDVSKWEILSQPDFEDHRLVFADPSRSARTSCQVEFSFDLNDDAIMVLRGFNVSEENMDKKRLITRRSVVEASNKTADGQLASRMRFKIVAHSPAAPGTCTREGNDEYNSGYVEVEMLRIVQLHQRSSLIVEFNQDSQASPRVDLKMIPGLKIQLMKRGRCNRDIAAYKDECHLISPASRSLADELTALRRLSPVAHLASFSSAADLQSFLIESQRTLVGSKLSVTSKTPLEFTQRIRIGMMYNLRNNSIHYISYEAGACKIKDFNGASNLPHTVLSADDISCGYLNVMSQQSAPRKLVGLVEFRNCTEPHPALVSFEDSVRNPCLNCSSDFGNWARRFENWTLAEKADASNQASLWHILVATLAALSVILLMALISVAVVCSKKSRQHVTSTDRGASNDSQNLIDRTAKHPDKNIKMRSLSANGSGNEAAGNANKDSKEDGCEYSCVNTTDGIYLLADLTASSNMPGTSS